MEVGLRREAHWLLDFAYPAVFPEVLESDFCGEHPDFPAWLASRTPAPEKAPQADDRA